MTRAPGETGRPWWVRVDVPENEVDAASGLLWAAGVEGIEELALEDGRARLVAATTETAAPGVLGVLGDRWPTDQGLADHDGWIESWRPFARPVRVGRLVVHPAWEEPPEEAPGDVRIALDAQRCFGQGNHPTTRMALAAVEALVRPGSHVLDVGCGSGVLAVAAARLGATRSVAVDLDSDALAATRSNAERNDVADLVEVTSTRVEDLTGRYDLVLANILAPTLVSLAPALGALVAPGRRLALGGFLADQREQVLAAYPQLSVVDIGCLEGWESALLRS